MLVAVQLSYNTESIGNSTVVGYAMVSGQLHYHGRCMDAY